jgi:hypothetical protein
MLFLPILVKLLVKPEPEAPPTKGFYTNMPDRQGRMLSGEPMPEIIVTPLSYFEVLIDYEVPDA